MTRALAWTAGVLAAVTVATGVHAAFRYRPDASGLDLAAQRVHWLSSVALAVVLVVGLVAYVWERRPDRRHGLPAFAVVAVIAGLLVVEVGLGARLAWDQLALRAVTTTRPSVRGVWLDHLPLKFLVVDAHEVGRDEFRRQVWLHAAALPAVVAVGSGLVVWWARRTGRPEARPVREPRA